MAMGTTDQPKTNPTMPAPGTPMPPPGWAGTQDVSKPFLPDDFDKVMLIKMYPNAESVEELRTLAYAAGEEALKLAEAARASVDVDLESDDPNKPAEPPPAPTPPPTPPPTPHREAHDKR